LFVHAVPHKSGSAEALHWQTPLMQVWDAGHAVEHVPQCVESVIKLAHVLLQLVWPAPHPFAHP
jgi:hypothetical protein